MKSALIGLGLVFLLATNSAAKAERFSFRHGVNVSHWLAQHPQGQYASPEKFNQDDAKWIAAQGYDHIRVPVDGRILFNTQGQLITELLQPMTQAIAWAQENQLGVIFDMHYLPGNAFLNDANENLLWTSPALMNSAADYWRQLATFYKDEGEILRFEILNEAVAPKNDDVNRLNSLVVDAIREVDVERIVYVSSNLWGQFATAPDVKVFSADPNVHYAFHYYHPMFFTHQKASWTDFGKMYNKPVSFPDVLNDLDDYFPEGHHALEPQHGDINEARVTLEFNKLGAWAKRNKVKVLISEFGVINSADDQSKARWASLVRDLCQKHGFAWSVWDYKSGFAMRDKNGKATATHRALLAK